MRTIDDKMAELRRLLGELDTVLVAFSGGVDSAFLLAVATDVLGDRCTALTALSETLPEREWTDAKALGERIGVRHVTVRSNELEIEGYRTNPKNRCYYCKTELYGLCRVKATELGIATIVDGCNLDDLGDYRPGRIAAAENEVRSPLIEAGLTKAEIRELSRRMDLPTWTKAAFACLGSRFPYGTTITAARLAQVDRCEQALRDLGFPQMRARWHDTMVRIEVPPDDLARLVEPTVREAVVTACKDAGFMYVTVDLQGYRMGSMNETLPQADRAPAGVVELSRLRLSRS